MNGPSATQAETVLNGKLGELLIARHPRWNEDNVFIDSTQVLRGHEAEKSMFWLFRTVVSPWLLRPSSAGMHPS